MVTLARPRPTLTPEEQAAIMLYNKPVTLCPPGGYAPTFKQGLGNLTTALADRGTKVGKKGAAN